MILKHIEDVMLLIVTHHIITNLMLLKNSSMDHDVTYCIAIIDIITLYYVLVM